MKIKPSMKPAPKATAQQRPAQQFTQGSLTPTSAARIRAKVNRIIGK